MQNDQRSDKRVDPGVGAHAAEATAPASLSRRRFLGRLGGVAAVTIAAGAARLPAPLGSPGATAEGTAVGSVSADERREQAFDMRYQAAVAQRDRPLPDHPTNGDEALYANQIGNYCKALPHNELGEVEPQAYQALVHAMATNAAADFEAIPLGGTVQLVNPQAALAFVLEGADSHHLEIAAPPAFSSEAEAGEMAELYWQALARDVPFAQYGAEPLTTAAMQDLARFSTVRGVDAGTLFRGLTPGDATGPYISQFLVRDVPFRPRTLVQLYRTTRAGDDHMTTYARWLAIQNGVPATVRNTFDPVPRFIHDGRGLGEYVHGCQSGCPASAGERLSASPFDASFFAAVNAALLLLSFGPEALDEGNPYAALTDQSAFATFGPPHALDLVTRVLNPALKAAWYQKWLVHRRVRPEEYAGRVHTHQLGLATYPIHAKLLHSQAVADVFAAYGSYLLPMAYPEGCPTHPAYPSGHATFAGAGVTMLKAFFEESFPFPEPQVPTDDGSALVAYRGTLTVGGELNKLASNIAGGRLIAGVHWRSDATAGLRLGEAVALSILSDLRATHAEEFGGFTLTKFDGTTISI